MIPIREGQGNFVVINVSIWITLTRIFDNERTAKAIWILSFMVTVIPVTASWVRLCKSAMKRVDHPTFIFEEAHYKVISKHSTGRNRALRDAAGPIHCHRSGLVLAVEVNASRLIAKPVGYMYDDAVPNVDIDRGTGPLSIDAYNRPSKAVRGSRYPGNVPIEFNCPLSTASRTCDLAKQVQCQSSYDS
jgi:hypothetical protein